MTGSMARNISMATSSVGSSTLTTWKRRLSAASFSKYCLYSAHVVAAMVRNSPRASAGFNRLAASFWPAWPPAPIKVWASSINKIIGWVADWTSWITCFKRFSNSPFTLAPACNSPISSVCSWTFFKASGTWLFTIFSAKPSTTAVFPTPGSPVKMGLFWRRRIRISSIKRISNSRPITGSIRPLCAFWVRLIVYWSSAGVLFLAKCCAGSVLSLGAVSCKTSCSILFEHRSKNLCFIVSIGNSSNWLEARNAIWCKSGAVKSATKIWPVRMTGFCSAEASNHACSNKRIMDWANIGVRVFPLGNWERLSCKSLTKKSWEILYFSTNKWRSFGSCCSNNSRKKCSISIS